MFDMDEGKALPGIDTEEKLEPKTLPENIIVKSEEDSFSSDTEEQNEVELNEEERKIRFEKLTQLLSKSKAYTNYLKLKLTKAKQDEENAAKRAKKFQKAKVVSSEAVTDQTKSPRKRILQEVVNSSEKEIECKKTRVSLARMMTSANGSENGKNTLSIGRTLLPIVSLPRIQLFSNGTLRPYQEEGVQWLKALYENGVNGILADEMGLGKTVQVIAMLCHLYSVGCAGPFLVICPLSTLCNWKREFHRFAPELPTLVYYGNEKERVRLQSQLRRRYEVKGEKRYPVVLTSYQIPMSDSKFLSGFRWKYLVVDEAQRMKNNNCKFVRMMRELKSDNRLLLTGTPLQNDLTELWSLLNFLMPELFNDSGLFEVLFDVRELQNDCNNEKIVEQEKSQHVLSALHEILAPFMLRRVKADVEIDLPPKKEVLVYAPMTEIQHELYRATLEYNIKILTRKEEEITGVDSPYAKLAPRKCRRTTNYAKYFSRDSSQDSNSEESEDNSSSSASLNVNEVDVSIGSYHVTLKMYHPMMQLRKIVNHPYLVHFPVRPGTKEPLIDENVVTSSGKFLVLDTMLKKLKERGHKVLLFSTFVMVLDLVEEMLDIRGWKYCRLDGGHSLDSREENIQLFNNDPDILVFLISTRAGGLGLNLTSADTVIIFDSDWNPQVDLQAQDRCHRIGQTKPVMVYRLMTRGTIDQKIVERATAKRKLEKMVIHNGKFKMNNFEQDASDPNELMKLLDSKDHVLEVDSHNSGVFTEEELEFLLDRSNIAPPKREACDIKSTKFEMVREDIVGIF